MQRIIETGADVGRSSAYLRVWIDQLSSTASLAGRGAVSASSAPSVPYLARARFMFCRSKFLVTNSFNRGQIAAASADAICRGGAFGFAFLRRLPPTEYRKWKMRRAEAENAASAERHAKRRLCKCGKVKMILPVMQWPGVDALRRARIDHVRLRPQSATMIIAPESITKGCALCFTNAGLPKSRARCF